MFLCFHIDAEI